MGFHSLVLVTLYAVSLLSMMGSESSAYLKKLLGMTGTVEYATERANYSTFPKYSLDRKTQVSLDKYGWIIRKYSARYGVDWRLMLAVMRQESRFEHEAESPKGAYGLMQLVPDTQDELVDKLGLEDAIGPYNNIRAGIFHFSTLYRMVDAKTEEDRVRLAIAAYNCGLGRILNAQDVSRFFGDEPLTWHGVRDALPFLSKRYSSIHKNIWEGGRPSSGFLSNWQETTKYVDNVMQYYKEYRSNL